ncbi:hypothetical protein C8R44DRAFT_809901, partial [Mycena epipterygia]
MNPDWRNVGFASLEFPYFAAIPSTSSDNAVLLARKKPLTSSNWPSTYTTTICIGLRMVFAISWNLASTVIGTGEQGWRWQKQKFCVAVGHTSVLAVIETWRDSCLIKCFVTRWTLRVL